jgi:hypothetical protein
MSATRIKLITRTGLRFCLGLLLILVLSPVLLAVFLIAGPLLWLPPRLRD